MFHYCEQEIDEIEAGNREFKWHDFYNPEGIKKNAKEVFEVVKKRGESCTYDNRYIFTGSDGIGLLANARNPECCIYDYIFTKNRKHRLAISAIDAKFLQVGQPIYRLGLCTRSYQERYENEMLILDPTEKTIETLCNLPFAESSWKQNKTEFVNRLKSDKPPKVNVITFYTEKKLRQSIARLKVSQDIPYRPSLIVRESIAAGAARLKQNNQEFSLELKEYQLSCFEYFLNKCTNTTKQPSKSARKI